ncbi:MAG: D-glycero-beta-D-manno-heptose 1-phosphate adenylyltransferase [Candidatus Zixiibacteriota bacterium]
MVPTDKSTNWGVVSLATLVRLRRQWRRRGLRVVFTNGVFDVLHRGHLDLLVQARGYGDVLVVGLNSDASTRRLKGPGRPVNSQRDRAALLASLRPVDCVCLFSESTPLRLIRELHPDVLVKGAEYDRDAIVGADLVTGWGGTVRRVRMRAGYSSTNLIQCVATSGRRARS